MLKCSQLTLIFLLPSPLCFAQPGVFLTGSGHAVPLPSARGTQVVMASVWLRKSDKPLKISRIAATGTMTPNPSVEGVSYELLFLVCDQPDCLGAVRSPIVLWQDDWQTPLRLLATRSFGIDERHVEAQVLSKQGTNNEIGDLYVAMAIKLLHGTPVVSGTAKAELLRVEVVP